MVSKPTCAEPPIEQCYVSSSHLFFPDHACKAARCSLVSLSCRLSSAECSWSAKQHVSPASYLVNVDRIPSHTSCLPAHISPEAAVSKQPVQRRWVLMRPVRPPSFISSSLGTPLSLHLHEHSSCFVQAHG